MRGDDAATVVVFGGSRWQWVTRESVGNSVVIVTVDGNNGSGVRTVDGALGFVSAGSLPLSWLLSLLGGEGELVGLLGFTSSSPSSLSPLLSLSLLLSSFPLPLLSPHEGRETAVVTSVGTGRWWWWWLNETAVGWQRA